jgi:hypothetical protein
VTPGQIFTFNADSSGGGCTGFVAAREPSDGPLITSLDIEAIAPNITDANSQVTCLSNAFAFCQARVLDGVLDIFLARCGVDIGCSTGINSGQAFSINLSDLALDRLGNPIPDPNDPGAFETVAGGGWIADQLFSAIADPSGGQPTTPFITAPEPSCVFLLFAGATALAARRRIMKG